MADKSIEIKYVCSEKKLADICTKALPRDRFQELRYDLSVCDAKLVNGGSIEL